MGTKPVKICYVPIANSILELRGFVSRCNISLKSSQRWNIVGMDERKITLSYDFVVITIDRERVERAFREVAVVSNEVLCKPKKNTVVYPADIVGREAVELNTEQIWKMVYEDNDGKTLECNSMIIYFPNEDIEKYFEKM